MPQLGDLRVRSRRSVGFALPVYQKLTWIARFQVQGLSSESVSSAEHQLQVDRDDCSGVRLASSIASAHCASRKNLSPAPLTHSLSLCSPRLIMAHKSFYIYASVRASVLAPSSAWQSWANTVTPLSLQRLDGEERIVIAKCHTPPAPGPARQAVGGRLLPPARAAAPAQGGPLAASCRSDGTGQVAPRRE